MTEKMNNILLIYHKEDNDGVFSGGLFLNYLTSNLKIRRENITLFGSEYNELSRFSNENSVESLHEKYDTIIMADLSFNDTKYMKKLYNEFGNNFIWCDHHAPIIKASFSEKFSDTIGIRDTTRSAILCVWKYLYDQFDEQYNLARKYKTNKSQVPELLRILSAWDSWTYKENNYDADYVRNVNKGVTIKYNLDIDKCVELIQELIQLYLNPNKEFSSTIKDKKIIKELEKFGKQLNDYDDQVMSDIIKYSGDCTWKVMLSPLYPGGEPTWRPACAIFHQGASSSRMFDSLRKMNPDIMNGIVFKHSKSGNWTISLYNVRECDEQDWYGRFHCGEFMKNKYKGGGHVGAAGCSITQEQFIKILKKKEL